MNKKPNRSRTVSSLNTKQNNIIKKEQNNNKLIFFLLAGALFTTLVVYFKVFNFQFINSWDDTQYIIENQYIQSFSLNHLIKLCTGFFVSNYQPITMLSYAVEYIVGNGSPLVFHGLNIAIHLINSYLVFSLIRNISSRNSVVALITAAFFAIHPMHIESVAWVSELKDVLYSFFFLLGLIHYCRFIAEKQTKFLIYTFLFFALSCLSKSAAVIFPLIMLLLDYYLDRSFRVKTLLEKIPFFLLSLVIGIIAIYSQKGSIQEMAPATTLVEHISITSFSFLSYITKLFVPIHLSAIYPYPTEVGHSLLPFYYYLSIPLMLGLFVFVWYSRRWGKTVIFGFLFFVFSIILVLQFIKVGAATMADRYSYIPYIGLLFILAKGFEQFLLNPKLITYKKQAIFVLISFFTGFALIANERTKVWESNNTLFTDNIEKYPDCSTAYFNRASGKNDINDFQGAIIDYNKVIEIQPNYLCAYTNRGVLKCKINDYAGAMSDFNYVIKYSNNDTNAFYNRGLLFSALKKYAEAIPDYDKAIQLNPEYAEVYNNRAIAFYNLRKYEMALTDLNKAIEINPNLTIAINNRNIVLAILNNHVRK